MAPQSLPEEVPLSGDLREGDSFLGREAGQGPSEVCAWPPRGPVRGQGAEHSELRGKGGLNTEMQAQITWDLVTRIRLWLWISF